MVGMALSLSLILPRLLIVGGNLASRNTPDLDGLADIGQHLEPYDAHGLQKPQSPADAKR